MPIGILEFENVLEDIKKNKISFLRCDDIKDYYNILIPTQSNWQQLFSALEKNTSIKYFRFYCDQKYYLETGKAIHKVLKKNKSLKKLNLIHNKLGYKASRLVFKSLYYNNSLTKLDISYTKFGQKAVKYLCKALQKNNTLKTLFLTGNSLESKEIKTIAKSLKNNKTLTDIILMNNPLGVLGAKYLAKALRNNRTLSHISMNSNDVKPKGAKYIIQSMQNNPYLILHINILKFYDEFMEFYEIEMIRETLIKTLYRNRLLKLTQPIIDNLFNQL